MKCITKDVQMVLFWVVGLGLPVAVVVLFGNSDNSNAIKTTERLLIAEAQIETLNGQNLAMRNVVQYQKSRIDTLRWFRNRAIKADSLSNAKAKEWWGWKTDTQRPKKRGKE